MTKRFFKATDGKITTFRASATRVYHSANINCASFSGAHASPILGTVPAVEITEAEFAILNAAKHRRLYAQPNYRGFTKPSDSWVANEALEPAETETLGQRANAYIARYGNLLGFRA